MEPGLEPGLMSPQGTSTAPGGWNQVCTLPLLSLFFQSRILFGANLGGTSYLWLLQQLQRFINIEQISPRGLRKEFSLRSLSFSFCHPPPHSRLSLSVCVREEEGMQRKEMLERKTTGLGESERGMGSRERGRG